MISSQRPRGCEGTMSLPKQRGHLNSPGRRSIGLSTSTYPEVYHGVRLTWVRSFFLFLSRQKQLRRWIETSSLAQHLATRFVAGETLDQALQVARKLNREHIAATLDHLGESVTSLEEAA